MQVCLGIFHVETLSTCPFLGTCKDDPYVQKFHIHLLSKTLVSKIDKKYYPLFMDPK